MTNPPETSSVAHAPSRFQAIPLVALLIATLALAAAAWSWSDGRERIRDLKTELGRRLADSGKDVSETRLLARNADDAMRQVSEKVARIDAQMASYRGGKASQAEVLAARREETQMQLQAVELETEIARLWAQINFLVPNTSRLHTPSVSN